MGKHFRKTRHLTSLLILYSGGIRGILELTILQKILDEVGFDIPIQELFDLAIGTSTGRWFMVLVVTNAV